MPPETHELKQLVEGVAAVEANTGASAAGGVCICLGFVNNAIIFAKKTESAESTNAG